MTPERSWERVDRSKLGEVGWWEKGDSGRGSRGQHQYHHRRRAAALRANFLTPPWAAPFCPGAGRTVQQKKIRDRRRRLGVIRSLGLTVSNIKQEAGGGTLGLPASRSRGLQWALFQALIGQLGGQAGWILL